MSGLVKSSLRNEARMYLLYLAAGVAAIPAGMCYAILAAKGWEHWWTVLPLLALGFAMALLAWRFLEERLELRITAPVLTETRNAEVSAFGFGAVGGLATAAYFVVFLAQPPNTCYNGQQVAGEQGNALIAPSRMG